MILSEDSASDHGAEIRTVIVCSRVDLRGDVNSAAKAIQSRVGATPLDLC